MENEILYETCIGVIRKGEIEKVKNVDNPDNQDWDPDYLAVLGPDWDRVSTLTVRDVLYDIDRRGTGHVKFATLWGHRDSIDSGFDKFVLTRGGGIAIDDNRNIVSLYSPNNVDSNGILKILTRIFMNGGNGNVTVVGEEQEEPKEEN